MWLMTNRVPVNSTTKLIEYNEEVHRQYATFYQLIFTNNEMQWSPGVPLTVTRLANSRPVATEYQVYVFL
mgnify:CR=1 FL=1